MASNYYTRFAPSGSILHFGDAPERPPLTIPSKEIIRRRSRIDPALESSDKELPLMPPRLPPSVGLYRRNRVPSERKKARPVPVSERAIAKESDEDRHAIYHEFYLGEKKKRSRGNCVGFSPGRIDIYKNNVHSPLIAHISTTFSMLCLGVFGRLPEEPPVSLPAYQPVSSTITLPGKYGEASKSYKVPDELGNFGFTLSLPRIETLHKDSGADPSYVLAERKVRFFWRRCGYDELDALGGTGPKTDARLEGMKLIRDGNDKIRVVDNPKDIVAIYRPNDINGDQVGRFQFLGGGTDGVYGTEWGTLAIASGLVALSWDGELRAVLR